MLLGGASLQKLGARADEGERGRAGTVPELGNSLVCPHVCQVLLESHHRRQSIKRRIQRCGAGISLRNSMDAALRNVEVLLHVEEEKPGPGF